MRFAAAAAQSVPGARSTAVDFACAPVLSERAAGYGVSAAVYGGGDTIYEDNAGICGDIAAICGGNAGIDGEVGQAERVRRRRQAQKEHHEEEAEKKETDHVGRCDDDDVRMVIDVMVILCDGLSTTMRRLRRRILTKRAIDHAIPYYRAI
eukprot:1682024-Rhodomonas_salina.1